MTEISIQLNKELERLILLNDFDDKIYNAQIDIIITKLNSLKRNKTVKIDDSQSVKSWADQMEDEEKEQISREFPKLSKHDKSEKHAEWTSVVGKQRIITTPTYFNMDLLFDYPFTQPMKATHHLNFHCNTYHWVTRWFDETDILVKTEKFVNFILEIRNNKAVLSYKVDGRSKSVKLSLMDQVFSCQDQDGKPYDMKVKLIKDYIV